MKQAIFITGFNNWGKTSIIQYLFDDRQKYYYGSNYRIPAIGADFTVETHSNDDEWGQAWADKVQNRINHETRPDLNLFTALCPTMHTNNNFVDLLSNPPFSSYDKLHIFLIEYKWEHHAKLMIDNIKKLGATIPNVNFITINADMGLSDDQLRWDAKTGQIMNELKKIFP